MKQRKTLKGEEADKALCQALADGKTLRVHEKVGLVVINTNGVTSTVVRMHDDAEPEAVRRP